MNLKLQGYRDPSLCIGSLNQPSLLCPLLRNKQNAAVPVQTVEPLALNITLCQVMVSLSQKQGLDREVDGEWLTPLRAVVRDTLGGGVKLSYRQLHMLLGTVWKMVLTQRSRSKHVHEFNTIRLVHCC